MDQHENPYQSPAMEIGDAKPVASAAGSRALRRLARILTKWFFICGISAASSFFLGLVVNGGTMPRMLGMTAGILLFVIAYTIVECLPRTQALLKKRFIRGVAITGYATRLVASVVYPVGIFIDIWSGGFAIFIAESLFDHDDRLKLQMGGQGLDNSAYSFLSDFSLYFTTTVIQGILLNLILLSYMLVIYGLCRLFASLSSPTDAESSDFV